MGLECVMAPVVAGLASELLRTVHVDKALDQFGLCSITLGLEFPVFNRDPRDTPFTTPL